MTLPAHLAGGYLALKASSALLPQATPDKSIFLIAGILGAILPDIDTFRFRYIKDHHDSLSHTPLFWVLISLLIYGLGWFINNPSVEACAVALLIGTFSHLFLDWFSGRTAGIRVFYPFSKKVYSAFPLQPEMGKIPTLPNKKQLAFWKFYSENKLLLFSEALIAIIGLALFTKQFLV